MYNGYILALPPRIIDDVEEREIGKRGLFLLAKRSSRSNNLSHHFFRDVSLLEIRLKNNQLYNMFFVISRLRSGTKIRQSYQPTSTS
jgi:hypothetical protein